MADNILEVPKRKAARQKLKRDSDRYIDVGRNAAFILVAGIAAGVLSTVAQVLLWVATGQEAWALLLRDSRLTAALILGYSGTPAAGFDAKTMLVAVAIHFALSITYAALLLPLAKRLTLVPSLLVGACFGASLYFFNLFGFTFLFPWFRQARGIVTLASHLVFGVTAMLSYRWFGPQAARGQNPLRRS